LFTTGDGDKVNDKILKFFVAISIFALVYATLGIFALASVESEYIELDPIEDLDLQRLKNNWDENNKVQFQSQGINFTIENKFTKIIATVTEMEGRDVTVNILVPPEYIKPSVLGHIDANETMINWITTKNETWLKFNIRAHQTINFEISKGSIILGKLKKGVHNFWNYVEFNGDAKEGDTNIIIFISKSQANFEIDNKHMIVQYKTDFWDWYYPAEDTSSADCYYYVDDLGEEYRVVTHFKENPGDIKVHTFPGASEGLNWDSVKGGVARSWISLQVGAKKAVMDLFDPNPKYD
jgi:hypothetical protein